MNRAGAGRFRLVRSVAGLALLGGLSTPALAAPPPLSVYGQLPSVDNLRLSPDGTRWVAVMGDDKSAQIQVRATASNEVLSITATDKSKVRDVMWVGNDHVVTTISRTADVIDLQGPKREWFLLTYLDLTIGKQWRPLLTGIDDILNAAIGVPVAVMRDGQPIVAVPVYQFKSNQGVLSLAEVRLGRPGGRITATGTTNTRDFFVGPDGRAIAREDYDSRNGEWRLLLQQGGSFRTVYTETALIDRPGLYSFGRDTGTLLMSSHKSGEWADYEVKIADGSVCPAPETVDGDSVLTDPATRTLIGTIDTQLDKTEYAFFNPADQSLWRKLSRAFPGEQVSLVSWSDDRKTIILEVQGPTNGVALFKLDRVTGKAEFLADRYAGIGPGEINPVQSFTYQAADSLDIPAYLTLPKGRPAKGLPLILLAHGGPASRDYPGFDWWAQALASRGYAVLQPQFRGSTGFGAQHRQAGHGEWGRKMQTDLSDGVRDLVRKGTVDAKRVCIVGASYGGYAAMAGVTLDAGMYRCASAVAGVSDLRRMLASEIRDTGSSRNATLRYWQRFMGAANADDKSIDPWSPARLADKVTVPLQLIHGQDDTVVLPEQSRIMRDAMAKAGKPVEYLELAGEDHWLSRPATRIAMLEAQMAFLLKHNPPE